eukprot:930918-Prymnesium_polylepis.1
MAPWRHRSTLVSPPRVSPPTSPALIDHRLTMPVLETGGHTAQKSSQNHGVHAAARGTCRSPGW